MSDFTRVERPPVNRRGGRRPSERNIALEATLTNGGALSLPIQAGDTYAVTRNRVAGNAHKIAVRLNASVRTQPSDDRLSVLIWLEPKTA